MFDSNQNGKKQLIYDIDQVHSSRDRKTRGTPFLKQKRYKNELH